ncbi:hypothetical protein CE91St36_16730 [Christensenellaceae bacterium]|nr:hypothetical protein CE91St36_16730 [Christensenellaceae bacterium]BDF61524.1 hypothetical protein CE91St37_16740 [Christensenellaceae bacterium]
MTRGEALKDFFRKTILPVASAALLYCIFRSACVKNGELDYLWLWILCGLPFGIWRLRLWIIPGGGSLGGGIALFLLNFVFAGLIGGCVLVLRLLVAAWYVPLTLYRLLTAGCACIGLGPRYGTMENGRFADGKAIHRLMEKDRPFPQDGKPLSPSAARLGRLPTVPQRLRLLLPQNRIPL